MTDEPTSNPCQLADELPPLRAAFEAWASAKGHNTAYAVDGTRRIWLSPLTADLWSAWQAADAAAVARERERCAKVCDEHASIEGIAQNCAAAIRASAMPAESGS